MLLLLLLTSVAAQRPKIDPPRWFIPSSPTQAVCEEEGALSSTEIFQSPTSEIFIPEGRGKDICIFFAPPQPQKWQIGKGLAFKDISCSDGCCFYTPASSRRVQEEEAKNEENLFEWFETSSGNCDSPSGQKKARIILNRGSSTTANICASKVDGSFVMLEGDKVACKGQCCAFGCKSCKEE